MQPPVSLVDSYDRYFASRLYDRRYPQANPSTLAIVLAEISRQGQRVLDLGCGNGRYAQALLERSNATIVASDISGEAIDELSSRCAGHIANGRLRPLLGDLSVVTGTLDREARFDLVIMLFGVLGHIYSRALRRETLSSIHALLRPGGRIVLTVPNAARRFPRQQAAARRLVEAGHLEPGDILYERRSDDMVVNMYYHLYTLEELLQDLDQQGFRTVHVGAESILPESGIVRSPLLRHLDRLLGAFVPLRHAFGFLVVAEARGRTADTENERTTFPTPAPAPAPAPAPRLPECAEA